MPNTNRIQNSEKGDSLFNSEANKEITGLSGDPHDKFAAEDLPQHLHELLNLLWSASIRKELAMTESNCSPEIRALLELVGQNLDKAMKLATEADELI